MDQKHPSTEGIARHVHGANLALAVLLGLASKWRYVARLTSINMTLAKLTYGSGVPGVDDDA
jgi:hypothetical protein